MSSWIPTSSGSSETRWLILGEEGENLGMVNENNAEQKGMHGNEPLCRRYPLCLGGGHPRRELTMFRINFTTFIL